MVELRPTKKAAKSKLPGYIDAFVAEKLKELKAYDEPQRAGTPRGTPVGLSRAKYHAALHAFADLKGKTYARVVGVSHGTLRPWMADVKRADGRTDSEFGATVRRLFDEWFRDFRLWVCAEAVVNTRIREQ